MSDFEEEVLETEDLQLGTVIQSEEDEHAILSYITQEIEDVLTGSERKKMHENIKKWKRQREGRPELEVKSFPWDNSSNACVPMTMQITNGIYAFIKHAITIKKPLWSVTSKDSAKLKHAEGIQTLLNSLANSPNHMKFGETRNTLIYEAVSLGTQFVKVPWVTDKWNFKRKVGDMVETITTTKHDSPKAIAIPYEDFLTRSYWNDIQRAPWVGSVVHLMEHELLQRAAQGIYDQDVVEEMVKRPGDDIPEERLADLERMGISVGTESTKMHDVYEVFLFWDVDKDGIPEDIILWIDAVSGKLLRSQFNDLGKRPIVKVPYIERPHELYGIGVGWMVEHMQDEIDSLHNMRIDGTLLSMCQMYVTRRSSASATDETFRPLKNIIVDDPSKDFSVVKFPDIGYTTLQAELIAKEYADRVSGASDAMMGYENRATSARTTASGTMFLAQQGARSLTSILESIEAAISEIGEVVIYQLLRNKDRIIPQLPKLISPQELPFVTEFLETPLEDVPLLYSIRVQTTPDNLTEEAKRQNLLTLVQLYTMYGERSFQLAGIIYGNEQIPPQIKELATKFFIGSSEMMDKILSYFSVDNTDDFIPYIKDLKMMMEHIEGMKEQKLTQMGGMHGQGMPQMGRVPGGAPQPGPAMGAGGPPGGPPEAVERGAPTVGG